MTKDPPLKGGSLAFSGNESGNVLLYVFLAVGLLAALTYAYVKDSRENAASQGSVRITEELFSQANMIRSAVMQCAMEYPGGGGNMDDTGGSAGKIDNADNPNNPYPINPSSALNAKAPAGCTTTSSASGCVSAAANDQVRNLTCVGAPLGSTNMFQGANNQGRFLPPPAAGFTEWTYVNDTNGVYIQTTGSNDGTTSLALSRFMNKFATCQADLNYAGCGANCLTVWIQRNACP
jgi:hypothetical protein